MPGRKRVLRSRTEYVRTEEVAEVRREVAKYQRCKRLTAQWVVLALQRAQLRVKLARAGAAAQAARGPNTRSALGSAANLDGAGASKSSEI